MILEKFGKQIQPAITKKKSKVSFTTIFIFQTNISLQKIYSIALKSSISELNVPAAGWKNCF